MGTHGMLGDDACHCCHRSDGCDLHKATCDKCKNELVVCMECEKLDYCPRCVAIAASKMQARSRAILNGEITPVSRGVFWGVIIESDL